MIRPVRQFTAFAVLFIASSFLPPVVFGQGATATLSGTVVDQNGAVVVGVNIMLINNGTTLQRQAITNENGSFTIPLLPPGPYTLNAQRDGFSPVRVENVVLNVGDQKALQIQLKAGDVNASVTVDSNAETVRTDGGVGTVVNRQFVADIPLNGRSLQALIQLVPGVVLTANTGLAGSATATSSAQFSVNGSRTTSNSWMVDGVSANTGIAAGANNFPGASGSGQIAGTTALGGTNSLVSLDALQEFRIETSSYAAEYGRTPGGQISLLTRSGTNQFHGSASYYLRNEALDANNWFANATRQPKPRERQNFFSGVFGGPLRRDRLFFFASYEGLRLEQPKARVLPVPSAALRSQAMPAQRLYLNALPVPNGRDFGNGTAEFAASYSDPGSFNILALRLDGRLTDSLTGFFRINHAPSETKTRSYSTVTSLKARTDSYTGGMTWINGSRLTADLRIGWTRNPAQQSLAADSFGGAVVPNPSDIFLAGRDPSNAQFGFRFVGGGAFAMGRAASDVQRQFNAVGTVVGLVGSHQVKFGVDYRRVLPLLGGPGSLIETLIFSPSTVVSGRATYQITNADNVPRRPLFSNLSLFAQDTWRVRRRLTLTYGLRFERVPPPSEATGRLPRTLLGIENNALENPRLAPEGTPLFRRRFGEFAPRFGISYQLRTKPGSEATLRGGAGIFYDLGLGDIASSFQNIYPFLAVKLVSNVPFPLSDTVRTPPRLVVDPPQQFWLLDPNVRLPYTVQWNATWEQALGSAQSATVAYVGAAGHRLLMNQFYIQPLAEWPTASTNLFIERNLGRSNYSALQIQYQRRLNKGLQALASYTLAHSQDNSSADGNLAPPASQAGVFAQDFGPSDFDVRHVFSAAFAYDAPRFSGPTLLQAALNGWGLDLLARYQSAFPVNPTAGFLFFPDGTFIFPRPNTVPGQPLYIIDSNAPGGRRFNGAAFAMPTAGQQGDFPRNGLRGFPASQVDLTLRREFRVGEHVRLQLRAELFNLFNHPNFGAPVADISSGQFGQPTSTLNQSLGGLNALYQMGGPRSGQLAVKIIF